MPTDIRREDWLGAIAVIVLLIGAATGSAYAMLGMSVATLVVMTLFYRRRIGSGALLVTLVAAVTAAAIGIVLAIR